MPRHIHESVRFTATPFTNSLPSSRLSPAHNASPAPARTPRAATKPDIPRPMAPFKFVPVLVPFAAEAVPVPEPEPATDPEAGRDVVVTATVVAGTLVPVAEVAGTERVPEAEGTTPDADPVSRVPLLAVGTPPEGGRELEPGGTDKGAVPEAEGIADEAPLGRVSVVACKRLVSQRRRI